MAFTQVLRIMADNLPASEGASQTPPASPNGVGAGKPPPLPVVPKAPAAKQVVLLSSVAKPAPLEDQLILGSNVPASKAGASANPNVRLPKPGTSRWPIFSGEPVGSPSPTVPEAKETPAPAPRKAMPPPLPAPSAMPKTPDMPKIDAKKATGKLIPPIKLNQPISNKENTSRRNRSFSISPTRCRRA